jgi:hypothetical protein
MSQRGGKRAGAGRKPRADEQELLKLLKKGWPLKDRHTAVRKLSEQANAGDKEAFKILSGYAYGKPKEIHQHENPDGSALLQPVADVIDRIYGDSSEQT